MKHIFLIIIIIGILLATYYTMLWFKELNQKVDLINIYISDLQMNWIDVYIR
jgi:hypothetical protein